MNRREVLSLLAAAAVPGNLQAAGFQAPVGQSDFILRIGPVAVELAPKKIVKTLGYNGISPGPILRMQEGKRVTVEVHNDTDAPEVVHWHGLHIGADVDGAMEEGTPIVPPHGVRRYSFIPAPSGTRWYHTHTNAGRNLKRATYSGQFGFLYIEPATEPGNYDQEIFLALREWDPYMTTGGEEDTGMEVAYKDFSINDRALGYGAPVRVKQGQRVLFRILNASATMQRRIGLAAHQFQVTAMDGNPLPAPKKVEALELGPAERIDAIVEMNQPGIWILGTTVDHDRQEGMGIVIEYSGQSGQPRWTPPASDPWDYTAFGSPVSPIDPTQRIPLVFEKKFAGSRWIDKWTINGKEYPKTDRIQVKANGRYRLVFDNRSDEAHPVHLHRHTFELVKVEGVATSGVRKDVVVVRPKTQIEADFIADNPGLTLFHCHQQMHMDYGFMTMIEYI